MRSALVCLIGLTGLSYGQVGSPALGLIADHGAVRVMRGIPAAGNVDTPVDAGRTLSTIEPSPAQNFALATDATTGEVLIVTVAADDTTAQSTTVVGATVAPDQIILSPNGTAAALLHSTTQQLDLLSGLPQTPSVQSIHTSCGPLALAVSDDGQSLACSGAASIVVVAATGQSATLPIAGTPQALAFFHGSNAIAAISDLEVVTFADPLGAAARTLVWSKPAGSPANPQTTVGFGLSQDNSHLTITGSLGGVQTFDLSNNSGAYIDCGCTPTALAHLGGAVFRITGVESGSVKLYDAATGELMFMPATPVRIRRPIIRTTTNSRRELEQ